MRRTTGSMTVVVALLFVGWGATACSSSDSGTSASSTTTTTASKGFEVSTPDGQVSLSLDGQLPPNWPNSFPVPDGAAAAGSGSLGGSSSTEMVAVFSSPQTPDEVDNFYVDSAGLSVGAHSSAGNGERFVGSVQFSGEPSGRVTVVPKDGQSLMVIALRTDGTATTSVPGTTEADGPGTTRPASEASTSTTTGG